jgi:hypothetical protein
MPPTLIGHSTSSFVGLSRCSVSRILDRGCLRTGKSLETAVTAPRLIASVAVIVDWRGLISKSRCTTRVQDSKIQGHRGKPS